MKKKAKTVGKKKPNPGAGRCNGKRVEKQKKAMRRNSKPEFIDYAKDNNMNQQYNVPQHAITFGNPALYYDNNVYAHGNTSQSQNAPHSTRTYDSKSGGKGGVTMQTYSMNNWDQNYGGGNWSNAHCSAATYPNYPKRHTRRDKIKNEVVKHIGANIFQKRGHRHVVD